MAVATDKRGGQPAALAIDGTVALEAIFAGPIVGAIIGAGLYEIVRRAQRPS